MKLNFRDLKQQKFTIEAESSETIGEVKEKIEAEKGWEASTQKLIYSGKILADANTVESYKIDEKGFVVCMVSKPKAAAAAAAPKPAVPATPAQSSSTPAPPAAPQANPASTASNVPSTPTPAQPAAAAVAGGPGFNDPSAMLMGNQNAETIREMENMGFERSQIDLALRAAFFNPDRAVDYLLNGIPQNIQDEQRQAQQAQQAAAAGAQGATSPQPAATGAGAGAGEQNPDEPVNLFEAAAAAQQGGGAPRGGAARGAGAGAGQGGLGAALGAAMGGNQQGAGGAGGVDMNFLRSSPQFQQLRQLVQQNPAMLEPILQQVAEGNPSLAQMIGQNQEQFLQLLAEDVMGGTGAGGEGIGGMGDAGPLPPGAVPISVTEEERDAIERLCRLGFTRDQVIQAYFACDKNEELAANFLFEQPEDDEGGAQ